MLNEGNTSNDKIFPTSFRLHTGTYIYIYIYTYILYIYIHTYICTYIHVHVYYIYIYIYNICKCYMKVCYLDITSEDRYRKVA